MYYSAMRKLYMSILVCMLVLVTTVVTTYAWAGILVYSTSEMFFVDLADDVESDFKIKISTDGINFKDDLSAADIKRSILKNMEYYSEIDHFSDEQIEKVFEGIELHSLSTQIKDNKLGSFVYLQDIVKYGFDYKFDSIESEEARKSHFDFDIYLAFEYKDMDNINDSILNTNHNIYLSNISNMLVGDVQTVTLSNPFVFDNYFNGQVFERVTVNSASAGRVALSKYPIVDKGNPSLYDDVDPVDLTIYQGGTALPTVEDGVYSFGGMLQERDNIGFLQYNELHRPIISTSMLNEFIDNRGNEISIVDNPNGSWIVNVNEGLTIEKMVKFNVQMWIEGFDADCFEAINRMPIELNLTFSSTYEGL